VTHARIDKAFGKRKEPAMTRRLAWFTVFALAVVVQCAAAASSLDHDATAEQLSLDLKDHIKAQLRSGTFNSEILSNQLKQGYVKLKKSERRQGGNATAGPSDSITVSDFRCSNCLFEPFGDGFIPRPIIMMVMANERSCNNLVAQKILKKMGRTLDACNFVKTAIPECFVAKNWDSGWVCQVTSEIFRDMGVEVIAKTKANTTVSTAVYSGPSSYTRCVYEVVLKQVDICVGDFWETAQRRSLTAFTASIDLDFMKLISMPQGGSAAALDQSPWLDDNSLLYIWAGPFALEVWVVCLVMTVFSAIMLWLVEFGFSNWQDPGAKKNKDHEGYWALPYKYYQSLLGTLHRPPLRAGKYKDNCRENAISWAGRIVIYGYGVFVFFTSTHYMAQSMKIYSQGGPEKKMSSTSFADVPAAGKKMCLLDALYETVATKLPNANAYRLDDYGPVLEHVYKGRCDAAIVGKNEYQAYIAQARATFSVCDNPADPFGYSQCQDTKLKATPIDVIPSPEVCTEDCDPEMVRRYCPLRVVNDPNFFLDVPFAMPVAEWLNPYVSAWITQRKFAGTIKKAINQFLGGTDSNVCSGSYGAKPMPMDKMYGVWIFATSVMVLGGLVSFVPRFITYVVNTRKHMRGEHVDVHGTLGHTHEKSDVDIYEMSAKSGSAHLRYDGPDPGRVAMQQKVKNLHLSTSQLMTKIQDMADKQVGREKKHVEEIEKIKNSKAIKPKEHVVADAPWPMKAVADALDIQLHKREPSNSNGAAAEIAI